MKTFRSILWGLIFIALGVIIGLKQFDLIKFNIFFDGWWTLFIIIPSFVGLFDKNDIKGSLIGLCVGVSLLLACQDIISFGLIAKLIVPFIFIVIGLSFLFKNVFERKVNDRINELNKNMTSNVDTFVTFAGQNVNVDKEYKGSTVNAIFGGIDYDLTDAIIKEDCVINTTAIFGGITIYVPEDLKVEFKSTSLFGGVSDDRKHISTSDKSKTLYVNSLCMFGGVDVKCKKIKK